MPVEADVRPNTDGIAWKADLLRSRKAHLREWEAPGLSQGVDVTIVSLREALRKWCPVARFGTFVYCI